MGGRWRTLERKALALKPNEEQPRAKRTLAGKSRTSQHPATSEHNNIFIGCRYGRVSLNFELVLKGIGLPRAQMSISVIEPACMTLLED
jgi:hypothetical protein